MTIEKGLENNLRLLERGVQLLLTDKFARVTLDTERDTTFKGTVVTVIAEAFGETLEEIECPSEWRRFLKRKDCPAYLKKTITYKINAYYPKLSLPEEKNWIAIDR